MLQENLVQIAGVIDAAEAQMLQQCGIRYLGFPLRLPVHREDLTAEEAAAIIKSLAPPVFGVLITYLHEASEIAAFCHALGARIVQLHGDIERGELKRLKTLDPDLTVIKSLVIGMGDDKALEATMNEVSPFVDAFITDTFDPKTGATGATGKTHDWRVSRRLVKLADRPVILAGGLTPENVKRAILEVRPAGVDSHTGVEDSNGRKSREKVRQFLSEANKLLSSSNQSSDDQQLSSKRLMPGAHLATSDAIGLARCSAEPTITPTTAAPNIVPNGRGRCTSSKSTLNMIVLR